MKTTEQEFRQFIAHCNWWMKRLSLGQFTYAFQLADEDHDASCLTSNEMTALLTISTEREGFHSVPQLARHEMLEVLVDDSFKDMYRYYNDEYIQEQRHRLIHRLEKVLDIPSDKEVGHVKKPKGGCK